MTYITQATHQLKCCGFAHLSVVHTIYIYLQDDAKSETERNKKERRKIRKTIQKIGKSL